MKNFFKKIFSDDVDVEAEKKRIEIEKSTGPLFFLYNQGPYKKIGPQPEDFTGENAKNNNEEILKKFKNLNLLKKELWHGIGPKIRPNAWRILFKYIPYNFTSHSKILKKKRDQYKDFTIQYTEEKLLKENDKKIIECIKLIKKDVLRTLPESHLFKNEIIKKSMIRILLIYSIRHPTHFYSQGMNDLLAPILSVFLGGLFKRSYLEVVNNMGKFEKIINEDFIFEAEADSFHCFSLFLSSMKENYLSGFEGVNINLEKINKLLLKSDKNLVKFFEKNHIEIFHFGFRWVFCLLMREFPIHLSIKLMDYYLVEELYPVELCIYLVLALILRYSFELKKMKREDIIIFLQNLPTHDWGEKDIELLVSEAYTLRQIIKL